jgi:hypothetical protein
VSEIEEQIVQATLAWKDRLRMRLLEEFGEERGEQIMRDSARASRRATGMISIRGWRSLISSTCSRCRRATASA